MIWKPRAREIQGRELAADRVQPLHRAAVVVGLVAGHQPLGQALERARGKGERVWREIHGIPPVVLQARAMSG